MVLSRFSQRPLNGGSIIAVALTASALFVGGCGKKAADIKTQSNELQSAVPTSTQAAPGTPEWYVNAALTAVRSNDYVAGITLLRNAAQLPGLNPNQLMSLHETRRAIMDDLVKRADKGDEKAKAALDAIQQSH